LDAGLPDLDNGSLVALSVREFAVQAIELFTVRRHDRLAGPVTRALWTQLG
jgi:hypothetical protein